MAAPEFDITGKRLIVTGGAGGIGKALVKYLSKHGAHVVIFDVNDDVGKAVAEEASAQSPATVHYLHADVAKRGEVFEAVNTAVKTLGGLDSLIHAVAVMAKLVTPEGVTEEQLTREIDVNIKGTVYSNAAVFDHLKAKGGTIINFGSDVALDAVPLASVYGMTKGAVHSHTRCLASEWGQYNIRVNALLPLAKSEMSEELKASIPVEFQQMNQRYVIDKIVLGHREGDGTKDIAPVLAFLVSDAARYITGQLIPVNGGMGCVR